MSWSATPHDGRSAGRRKRPRRGPRWVTEHAREIAEQQAEPPPRAFRDDARGPRRWMPRTEPAPRRVDHPDRPDYSDRPGYPDDDYGPAPRYGRDREPPRRHDDHEPYPHARDDRRREPHGHVPRRDDHRGYDDHGDRYDHRGPQSDRYADRQDDRPTRRHDDGPTQRARPERDPDRRHPDTDHHQPERPSARAGRDSDRHDPRGRPERDRDTDRHDSPSGVETPNTRDRNAQHAGEDAGTGPRKLTVTRVAAWRSRQLTQQGIAAFRRAATADGADRSGLTALTYPTMINYGADAAIAVALANTLFFSAATAESKTKVALYLLITVAPFALIAPVIGPLLDRLQRGRRLALAASFVGRAVLAMVMAQHFDDWLLYPAALGAMVLSRSFNVLKAAVTPRLLPPDITLTKVNSRLAMFGLAAGAVIGIAAGGFAVLFGSAGALWFTVVVCLAGAWLCLRIPAWVEVTEGEVQASLRDPGDDGPQSDTGGRRRREPLGRHVVVALWGNGTIRVLTGFLTLFVAFVVKAQTEQSAWQQVLLLGMVGVAAGVGSMAGNAIGARQHFGKPDQVILTCVSVVTGVAVLAALVGGIGTAVLVALVGSVCSALAKVCQDAVIQNDMSEASRASAFGRTETILQLSWTFGGALGVLLPPTYWLGFAVVSGVLALGTAQTVMTQRGGTLIPRFGGNRPARPSLRLRGTRPRNGDRKAGERPHNGERTNGGDRPGNGDRGHSGERPPERTPGERPHERPRDGGQPRRPRDPRPQQDAW